MTDGSTLSYRESVAVVRKVAEVAHSVGATVEAELGRTGGAEDHLSVDERQTVFTVPDEARDFVEATGIDTVAIGAAHGTYEDEPRLDFERLSAIRAVVDVPLVLHGASGVSDQSIREAVKRRISKINV